MTTRAGWISRLTVSTVLSLAAVGASAQQTIKVGEINSYKAQPAFLGPYKNGWNLALEQVNAAGGVLGKQLEVVSRDDNGNPGDTIRVAQELIAQVAAGLQRRDLGAHRPVRQRLDDLLLGGGVTKPGETFVKPALIDNQLERLLQIDAAAQQICVKNIAGVREHAHQLG